MRRPAEDLPQRRLVYELRYTIDEGKMIEAASLAASHPRGMQSRHVVHNVGRARLRALARSMRLRARSARSDG